MKTMILAVALAVALMLAGCGGGGSKGGAGAGMPSVQTPTPQTPTTPRPTIRVARLPLSGEPATPAVAVEIPDNTVRITPGQRREMNVGGRSILVRCPSGGASCHVGVHEGELWYRLDGAIPFALASLPSTPTPPPTIVIVSASPFGPGKPLSLPTGHTLQTSTTHTIYAGESRTVGERTTIRCAAGRGNCMVNVEDDGSATLWAGTLRIETVGVPTVPPTTHTPTTPTPSYGPGTIPLPTGHTLVSGTIPAGETRTVLESGNRRTTIRCTAGRGNCRFTVAADGTVTLIAGNLQIETVTVVGGSGQSTGFVQRNQEVRGQTTTVASVTGYGPWSRSDYGFLATSLVQDATGARLVLDSAYHRFSPSRGQRLTFRGNAYSNDGLTGTINLNYNRGTVDASINDSQSRSLFRMTGVPVDGANFRKVDGADSLQGSFVRRTDGTGVDRAVGMASTSTRAMAFDIPKR